jgi:hypothetical protein
MHSLKSRASHDEHRVQSEIANHRAELPDVSVVVPIKGSPKTVEELTSALLQQRYEGKVQIVYVGDFDDSAWSPLTAEIENGAIEIVEVQIETPRRDTNAKRSIGLSYATGKVIALTDGDFVPHPNWIASGVTRINEGHSVVGGRMVGIEDSFWSVYTDNNLIGSKTPRINGCYLITKDNFGKPGRKPPITANVFMAREVYEVVGGPPAQFTTCFEDYPWFRAIVDYGYEILMDETLVGFHFHRGGFQTMASDYFRSGYGCADYVVSIPGCRFGRKRAVQAPTALLIEAAILAGFAIQPLAVGLVGIVILSTFLGVTWHRQRTPASLLYPILTAFLGTAFSLGFMYRFLRRGWRAPVLSVLKDIRRVETARISKNTFPLRVEDVAQVNQIDDGPRNEIPTTVAPYAHRSPRLTAYTCMLDQSAYVSSQRNGDRK